MVSARIPVWVDLKALAYVYNGALVTATNRNETGSFTGKRMQLGTHIKQDSEKQITRVEPRGKAMKWKGRHEQGKMECQYDQSNFYVPMELS